MKITEKEFDSYLQKEKGWRKFKCGYEYVYDFKLHKVPTVIIKVLSSINTGDGESRNKGSDAIRVFAVRQAYNVETERMEIVGGYISKQVVDITIHWREDLLNAYKIVLSQVMVRARREKLVIFPEN
jgi:hypothetical protein